MSEFSVKKNKTCYMCKECHRKYSKAHYNLNKTYYIEKAKAGRKITYQVNSENVTEYKKSKGCKYCPESDPVCLDFHHVDEKDKEFTISNKISHLSWDSLLTEIKKCEVVCSNCHRKLHAGRVLSEWLGWESNPQSSHVLSVSGLPLPT